MQVQILFLLLAIARCCEAALNRLIPFKTKNQYLKDQIKIHYFSENCDELMSLDVRNLERVDFDAKKRTVIFAHGWLEDTNLNIFSCQRLRKPMLKYHDVNMMCVDWSFMTQDLVYPYAVKNLIKLAPFLGEFVDQLMDRYKLDNDKVILIGFSLGAHLSGFTGEASKHKLNIIGLDPAGPGFIEFIPPNRRLNPRQGKFVQTIHTNALFLGIYVTTGTADYYVNGGIQQPQCFWSICSHYTAIDAFAETLKTNRTLLGARCDSYVSLALGQCLLEEGATSRMGSLDIDTNARGIYNVKYP